MLRHCLDDAVRNRCDVSAGKRAVRYMNRIADGCGNDLGIISVDIEYLSDLADQIYAAHADIIQSSQERRYIGSSRICRKDRLVDREDQSDIRLDSLCGKCLGRL